MHLSCMDPSASLLAHAGTMALSCGSDLLYYQSHKTVGLFAKRLSLFTEAVSQTNCNLVNKNHFPLTDQCSMHLLKNLLLTIKCLWVVRTSLPAYWHIWEPWHYHVVLTCFIVSPIKLWGYLQNDCPFLRKLYPRQIVVAITLNEK